MEQAGFSTGCLFMAKWPLEQMLEFYRHTGSEVVELSFLRLDELMGFEPSRRLAELAGSFKRVSIHAPSRGIRYGHNLDSSGAIEKLVYLSSKIPVAGIAMHPDVVDNFSVLENTGLPFLIENMDANSRSYTTPGEFEKLSRESPFGFVLDTQHTYEHDNSMSLGLELVDAMGGRLKQMHVSGQVLRERHAPLHRADNRHVISAFMDIAPSVPKIAEGVLTGDIAKMAGLEMEYLRGRYRDAACFFGYFAKTFLNGQKTSPSR